MMRGHHPAGRRGGVPDLRRAATGPWLVALPAWGDRCVDIAARYTIPALITALRMLGEAVTVMVWTDQPDRLGQVFRDAGEGGPVVAFAEVPGPDRSFESMSNCHRQAMAAAQPGERVILLTSDMVVSRELLITCAQHTARGMEIICCVPPRTLQDADPPIGASGRELMAWAWDNRHPMTRDCTWPDGRSYDVWRMYFEKDGEVAARVFLPHPIVVVPGGRSRLMFGPTIDVNLTANFSLSATYLITSPDEGAVVEVSPQDKEYLQAAPMRDRLADGGPSCPTFIRCGNPRHRMFWGRRVIIRGVGGDCGDEAVVRRIMG